MPKNVARAAFDLVLQIEHFPGLFSNYDCSEAVLNFGLNRIPSAHCVVAVGRNARTLKPAFIHTTAGDFVQNLRARIWLDPKGDWLPQEIDERWEKAGPAVIFDGYVAGMGYRRSTVGTSPVVYLTHWLSDLSYTSSLSDQSHPGNPAKFRWPAASRSGVQTTAPTEFLTNRVSSTLFQAPNIQTDFWAKTIHQTLYQLSKEDILWRIGEGDCEGLRKANDDAQRALSRIETHKEASDVVGTPDKGAGSPYHVPLSMKLGGNAALVARAVGRYFSQAQLEYYFNSTMWDKLIEYSAAFKFAIVPRVQTAMMVPFVPGLRSTFTKILDARDISNMESTMTAIRPLRGVGVLPGTMQTDVLDLNMRPAESLSRLGGCWSPGPNAVGMLMYVRPPIWLDGVMQDLHEPLKTSFAKVPGSATTPVAPANAQPDPQNKAAVKLLTGYYSDHAHYIFAQEMLRGRYATIQGKLRFDLAPGTNVVFRNTKRLFVDDDALGLDYIGMITRMGITLNAMAPSASTTFQLDYTRTDSENKSDATSIDHHPLYDTVFTGAPLVHEYLFPE